MACRLTLTAHRAECRQSFRSSVRVWAQGNATQADSKAEIYLGKGRFIEDDPSLYPTKDEWGTGGWAGGEEGLQQFIAQSQLEEAAKKEDPAKDAASAAPGSFAKGKDTIYVGKGQYIQDDARIYPSKEDAGPLPGSTGGFAGGERGLQHFIQTQSLEPAPPEVVNERQTRRDAIATVGVAAVAGASYFAYLFLTGQPLPDVPDVAELMSASSQVSEGALDTGVPAMPGATPSFAPALSENQIKLVGTGAAVLASIVGGAVVFKKTGEFVGNAAQVATGLVEDNLARMLVVGGAILVYYFLLM